MNRILIVLLPAALGATLLGCKSDDANKPDEKGPAASQNIHQLKQLNKIDVKVGTGPAAAIGDTVYIKYTGKLKNGVQFDSNDKKDGSPYAFTLGTQGVIAGWQEGVPGMKIGGIRKLEIPSNLAYGEASPSANIPPGADLYFELELLDVVRQGEEDYYDKTDIVAGTGKPVKIGSLIECNYVMKLVNGRVADDRSKANEPVRFRIGPKLKDGDRLVPKGVYTALLGMKEGGVRKMRIPPNIGYATSSNSAIPPNSIVLIELTLKKVIE